MAVVETRNLTKVFKQGELGAVNDVNLATKEGEFLVFLGPSGSGKTTLLRMIAGLETPTSGEILIGGQVVNPPDASRAPHRDGVPELRALSPPHRLQEHRVSAQGAEGPEGPAQEEGGMGGRPPRHRPPAGPQAARAFRRRETARRACPRDRPRAVGLPSRRAALEPRREAARVGPRGARTVPQEHRHDDDLRDARPGRGHGHGRSRRRDGQGDGPADRHAGRGLRRAGRHVRRDVPRLASDEPPVHRGDDHVASAPSISSRHARWRRSARFRFA